MRCPRQRYKSDRSDAHVRMAASFLAYLSPWCSIPSAQTPLLNRPRPAPIGTDFPDPRGSATRGCVEDLAVVR
jgi:hypothetical protein